MVDVVALHRPCFTSPLVGIWPFQCSFSMSSRQVAGPPASSGTTLAPLIVWVGGTTAPASSTKVGARSMLSTKRSSIRGAVTSGGYRMIIGTCMHSSYGHCFGFQRCEPQEKPLSPRYTTSVLSSSPMSRSACIMAPTPSSTACRDSSCIWRNLSVSQASHFLFAGQVSQPRVSQVSACTQAGPFVGTAA